MNLIKINNINMLDKLTYKYYRKNSERQICLVLHGGMAGIESPFISRIISTVADSQKSVFGFNMPYCERNEETASDNLIEEIAALTDVIDFLRKEGYDKITIAAKSLGAIVTSSYFEKNKAGDIEVVILGYVIGSVKTAAIAPYLKCVIQGELDRFGDRQAVLTEISQAGFGDDIRVIELEGADHSYRSAEGEAECQSLAIDYLLEILDASGSGWKT